MEYYAIYDMNDYILAYIDGIEELSCFTGLRIKDINYKFKKSSQFIFSYVGNKLVKIYKFF